MLEFIRIHQMNIMLSLSSICAVITLFVFLTKALPSKRKHALGWLEISATLLLISDRCAYIYRGDTSMLGYWMVRISNFLVFFLSLAVIQTFNLYLSDLLTNEGKLSKVPRRLKITEIITLIGELLVIVSQFTGLYYTFDEMNRYQRAPGFVLCYILPLLALLIQLSAIIQYHKRLRRGILISLLLFSVVPLIASLVQIFTYGLSLTNMSIVGMAVLVYVFALTDMNDAVARASRIQIEYLKEKQESMRRLFDQTAKAMAGAIDAKDKSKSGHPARVAEYARKIAEMSGKSEQECDEIYYAALLHDVGKIGIPDSIFDKAEKLTPEEQSIVERHTVIGEELLSRISEYPFLSVGARYHHERYDGTGYPDGLKGEAIPDIARILAVADAYDTMTSKRAFRDVMPQQKVREEFVKGSGTQFDPRYEKIMLQLIDADTEYRMREVEEVKELVQSVDLSEGGALHCSEYRRSVSQGILLSAKRTRISLCSRANADSDPKTSIPAIILFDSFDGCVHSDAEKIRNLNYLEYGEIWFDGHTVATAARNMRTNITRLDEPAQQENAGTSYLVEAERVGDHARVRITGGGQSAETIVALTDASRFAYIGLTGERCLISDVRVEETEETVAEGDIPRIAAKVSFINRIAGDIPNLQINGYRSAATEGIPVADGMRLAFHTMSLPTAHLVWHCPYIVFFTSKSKRVDDATYRELAMVRLDGEAQSSGKDVENKAAVKKGEEFQGWDMWKKQNKKGYDCVITFKRRGNKITTTTENVGISIRNVTTVKEETESIYVALTGDQCAITDIRIL